LVVNDPESARSWNYCWLVLVKVRSMYVYTWSPLANPSWHRNQAISPQTCSTIGSKTGNVGGKTTLLCWIWTTGKCLHRGVDSCPQSHASTLGYSSHCDRSLIKHITDFPPAENRICYWCTMKCLRCICICGVLWGASVCLLFTSVLHLSVLSLRFSYLLFLLSSAFFGGSWIHMSEALILKLDLCSRHVMHFHFLDCLFYASLVPGKA
jgi:hypothetical protein